MSDSTLRTEQLHDWLDRARAGDQTAYEELLSSAGARLERLARKMLRRFPDVRQVAETGDVLQNSLLWLLRALREVRPGSVRQFFGLAAEQMRRELLDLARHYGAARRNGKCQTLDALSDDSQVPGREPAAPAEDPAELDRWFTFHEAVVRLPWEEREVVGLIFYHGWTQAEVAALVQISERTVRRRWESALVKLHREIKLDN